MSFLSSPSGPTALRLRDGVTTLLSSRSVGASDSQAVFSSADSSNMFLFKSPSGHDSHPDFLHLILLVFEAVLEVVCVALPGYVVARRGLFGADAQKFLANLNVWIFTPCLVFSKLGSQLTADKLLDLIVIPVIFIVLTLVSWGCSLLVSRISRLNKRQTNFVTAMGVFGNSNSLPISLVISLSKTLKGLHWDRIPGDNDEEVAARGILYLLVFQQLGQLLRWSWGYNVLLAPETTKESEESDEPSVANNNEGNERGKAGTRSDYGSGAQSPHTISAFPSTSTLAEGSQDDSPVQESEVFITPTNGNITMPGEGNLAGHDDFAKGLARHPSVNHITQFPSYNQASNQTISPEQGSKKSRLGSFGPTIKQAWKRFTGALYTTYMKGFTKLPQGTQKMLAKMGSYIYRFFNAIWQSMNPPLWAMLIGVIVASVPALQHLVFDKGTFINNSATRAIRQNGDVAVPLILVVLGANLARNTIESDQIASTPAEKKAERNLLIAALISRMLLPTLIMSPFLALFAKYVPVSILDDPIFIIVCFLLTGAPSALQLAQICQVNNVFTGAMSKLLFQSYVVWILPSTLFLVVLALETVEWATM